MDKQTFLASGLLEVYILGHCTPEEVRTVEAMLAKHPELHQERLAIETALEQIAIAHSEPPPLWMKGRILDRVNEIEPSTTPSTAPNSGSTLSWRWLLLVGVLALSTLLAYRAYNAASIEAQQLHTQLQACQMRDSQSALTPEQIAVLNDPDTKRYRLKWQGQAPLEKTDAQVFVNDKNGVTLLGLAQMPTAAADRDYQLWVITKGNPKPIPLKVLSPNTLTTISLEKQTYYADAEAFAISIEPKGGSTTGIPTTVLMVGKVSG